MLPKNRGGKPPKTDGENFMEDPMNKWDALGGKNPPHPYFWFNTQKTAKQNPRLLDLKRGVHSQLPAPRLRAQTVHSGLGGDMFTAPDVKRLLLCKLHGQTFQIFGKNQRVGTFAFFSSRCLLPKYQRNTLPPKSWKWKIGPSNSSYL